MLFIHVTVFGQLGYLLQIRSLHWTVIKFNAEILSMAKVLKACRGVFASMVSLENKMLFSLREHFESPTKSQIISYNGASCCLFYLLVKWQTWIIQFMNSFINPVSWRDKRMDPCFYSSLCRYIIDPSSVLIE